MTQSYVTPTSLASMSPPHVVQGASGLARDWQPRSRPAQEERHLMRAARVATPTSAPVPAPSTSPLRTRLGDSARSSRPTGGDQVEMILGATRKDANEYDTALFDRDNFSNSG